VSAEGGVSAQKPKKKRRNKPNHKDTFRHPREGGDPSLFNL
jgi:hypothetical protein